MGADWPRKSLAAISERPQYGAIARGGNEFSGPLFIRQTDISTGRIDWSSVPRCDLPPTEAGKYTVQTGDILISRLGAGVGTAATVDAGNEAVFAGYLVRFQPIPKHADAHFIGYQLKSQSWRDHVHGFRAGAAQPTLNAHQMGAFELELPPLSTQRAIAHILRTLDDKIELNRRTNETLEAMARALFQSWFVDFDPVRAKDEGRRPAGMDADTAKLFPSDFVDSELGPIPKGWIASELSKVANLNPPRRLSKGEPAPYVEMASLPTAGTRPSAWPDRAYGSGTKFQNGDTLIARITPCLENGKSGYVDFLEDGQIGWGSTEYIVIEPKTPLPHEWAYLLVRDERFREFAAQKMEGSTGRQRVSAEALGRFPVSAPSPAVGHAFGAIIRPWFRIMATNHNSSRNLADLRDTLLPRLLSGELSVREAEKFVGSAA